MITKSVNAQFTVEEGSREVLAKITTNAVDLVGDVVLPEGCNNITKAAGIKVLANHDYRTQYPIGKFLWAKVVDNAILAKLKLHDKSEAARVAFDLLQLGQEEGFGYVDFSIGFEVEKRRSPTIEDKAAFPGVANIIEKWTLVETSVVGLPCNQEAIALAVSKGVSPETSRFLNRDFRQVLAQSLMKNLHRLA